MNQTTTDQSTNRTAKPFQAAERRDIVKNEFLDGRIVPKPAASRWHNLIETNLVVAIGSRIPRRLR
jgi:Uma2 family endonuclease